MPKIERAAVPPNLLIKPKVTVYAVAVFVLILILAYVFIVLLSGCVFCQEQMINKPMLVASAGYTVAQS